MADPSGTLTPERIRAALERLAAILSDQGVTARIDVFGGASLALAYSRNRTATADVDGSYSPIAAVETAAEQVAYEMDLAAGWLGADEHVLDSRAGLGDGVRRILCHPRVTVVRGLGPATL